MPIAEPSHPSAACHHRSPAPTHPSAPHPPQSLAADRASALSNIALNFSPHPPVAPPAGSPVSPSPVAASRLASNPVTPFPADLPPDYPLPPSRAHRKAAFRLRHAAQKFIRHFGRRHVVFVTLTLAEPDRDLAASNRRLSALLAQLRKLQPALQYLWVVDAGASDRLHYHVLVALPDNVRAGTDFSVYRTPGRPPLAKIRAAVNDATRRFWDLLDGLAVIHGFGRTEVFPLRKATAAVARYLVKNFRNLQSRRVVSDARRRTWGMSAGAPRPPRPNDFALNHPGSTHHRARIAEAAQQVGISSLDEAAYLLGSRWHHLLCSIAYGPEPQERIDRLRRDVERVGPALRRLAHLRAEAEARMVLGHLSADSDSPGVPRSRRRRRHPSNGISRARPIGTEAGRAGSRRSAAEATTARRAAAAGRPEAAPDQACADGASPATGACAGEGHTRI